MGRNQKAIIRMAGMVLGVVLVYVLLLTFQSRKLSHSSGEYNESCKKLDIARRVPSSERDTDARIKRLKKELSRLRAMGARHENVAAAIESFEAEAYRLGISEKLVIEETGSKGKEASANRLEFKIRLRCTYRVLVKYITSLKKLPVLAAVEGLAVRKEDIDGEYLHAELIVGTYTLP